ncbi:hypothetical protein A311_01306 [Escherichia coli KTE146]|uniref:DUF551 domain-containing protein n=1 Tax=Escherichia coli TaxID=562 RepID=UPI0002A41ED5|nr:DUF551 domain-containing protein [Escherichia coli]ELG90637.1 hypothetical protein A311_01306 [Escherichia coli KTE146]
MNSITKERIELFIKNPLENGLTRGEQMELARIALASLEAEPVVYMWDSERKDIDAPGYYRTEHLVFAESSVKQWGGRVVPLYTAQPVPVTPDGWISCSERMPDDGQHVIILCDGAFVLYAQYRDGEFFDVVRNGEEFFETQSRNVTHWMPLPEPPKEVNRG